MLRAAICARVSCPKQPGRSRWTVHRLTWWLMLGPDALHTPSADVDRAFAAVVPDMQWCLMDSSASWTILSDGLWVAGAQAGVAMASAAELSFNWMGFISAMISNLTFSFRAVLSKKCATALLQCTLSCSSAHCQFSPSVGQPTATLRTRFSRRGKSSFWNMSHYVPSIQ